MKAAYEKGTIAAWQEFLNGNPPPHEAAEARYFMQRLEKEHAEKWRSISGSERPVDFRSYIFKYPESKYISDAKVRLSQLEEDAAWKGAKTQAQLRSFISRYPQSSRLEEAKHELVWIAVRDSNSEDRLRDFVTNNPTSKHAGEAEAWLTSIKQARDDAAARAVAEAAAASKQLEDERTRVQALKRSPTESIRLRMLWLLCSLGPGAREGLVVRAPIQLMVRPEDRAPACVKELSRSGIVYPTGPTMFMVSPTNGASLTFARTGAEVLAASDRWGEVAGLNLGATGDVPPNVWFRDGGFSLKEGLLQIKEGTLASLNGKDYKFGRGKWIEVK